VSDRIRRSFALTSENSHRYFPSTRELLLVRFDAEVVGTATVFPGDGYLARRAREANRRLLGLPSFANLKQLADGGVITNPLLNLGDAVARAALDPALARERSQWFDVQATHSQRSINSYRAADELELKLPWKDLPFDARLVRSILVLHYEGTVSADGFATGQRDGFVVPATGRNVRFVGIADEITDDHSDEGDTITLKCRDLTGVLLDEQFPTDAEIAVVPGATIVEAVEQVLRSAGPIADLIRGPFLRPASLAPTIIDPKLYPRLATRASLRRQANEGKGPAKAAVIRNVVKAEAVTYWDLITDLCVSHGLIPTIELDALVIQEPRTFFRGAPEGFAEQANQTLFPTTYRRLIGDHQYPYRRLKYGHDLSSLRFSRKLAGVKTPAVRVNIRNPDAKDASKRLISVIHPPDAEAALKKKGGTQTGQVQQITGSMGKAGKGNSADPSANHIQVINLRLPGVISEAVARKYAELIYEGQARNEVGVTVQTSDLASFSDHPSFDPNEDPDLLALRAGDPVQIVVEPSERNRGGIWSLTDLNEMVDRARRGAGAGDAVGLLKGQGFSQPAAEQLVRILSSANLQTEFRLTSATVTFDAEGEDFTIALDLRNYIKIHADPEDSSAGPLAQTSGAPTK